MHSARRTAKARLVGAGQRAVGQLAQPGPRSTRRPGRRRRRPAPRDRRRRSRPAGRRAGPRAGAGGPSSSGGGPVLGQAPASLQGARPARGRRRRPAGRRVPRSARRPPRPRPGRRRVEDAGQLGQLLDPARGVAAAADDPVVGGVEGGGERRAGRPRPRGADAAQQVGDAGEDRGDGGAVGIERLGAGLDQRGQRRPGGAGEEEADLRPRGSGVTSPRRARCRRAAAASPGTAPR